MKILHKNKKKIDIIDEEAVWPSSQGAEFIIWWFQFKAHHIHCMDLFAVAPNLTPGLHCLSIQLFCLQPIGAFKHFVYLGPVYMEVGDPR